MATAKKTSKNSKAAKASNKTTNKTTVKTTKKPATKKTTASSKAKSPATKKVTSKKSSTTKSISTKGGDFFSEVIKLATKAQKTTQAQLKSLLKDLNTLDKQQVQLSKKLYTSKGTSLQAVESQLAKLKTQVTATRTALLNAENSADKIASLIDWVNNTSSRPAPTAYMPSSPATNRPTLVKPAPLSKPKPMPAIQDFDLEEEDYPDEEELDLDDDEEEMGFVFGDDDELQDDEMGR